MKRLIIRLLLLSLPFSAFLAYWEFKFKAINADALKVKSNLLEQKLDDIEILILGSSHPYCGILPSFFSKPAFNLSFPAQSLYYDRALLRKYAGDMPQIKTVILPISYFSMYYNLDMFNAKFCNAYHYYCGIPQRDWRKSLEVANYSAFYLHRNSYTRKNIFFPPVKDLSAEYDAYGGWIKAGHQSTDMQKDVEIALIRHNNRMMDPKYIRGNKRYIEDMIAYSQERGVNVLFITLPLPQAYILGMDLERWKRTQQFMATLCSNYGVAYQDYSADDRFNNEDFRDGDHLNLAGAEKFTKILAADVAALDNYPTQFTQTEMSK